MNDLRKWNEPHKVKLTIKDYLRLDEAGAFRDYAKTELIEGVIVAVNSQFTPHSRFQTGLLRRLADAVEAAMPGYTALVEASVAMLPDSMPQPDISVTNYRESGREALPVSSVALIVEVADTTARFDLGKKARIYAAAGVPEYWVAELATRTVHQFSAPSAKGYGDRRDVPLGERIESVTIPGLAVETLGL